MAPELVLVRIDDRLIHGQVAVGWVKATHPHHVVVANDAAANDPLQKSLLEMAVPPQLGVSVCEVGQLADLIHTPAFDRRRLLVLFSNPKDVVRAVEVGMEFSTLNVGGMRYSPGKRQIIKAVAIGPEDIECFKKLMARKIHITIQMVPTDEPVEMDKYL